MFDAVPDDWRDGSLGELCRIAIGGTPSRAEPRYWSNAAEGLPWVSIADLRSPTVEQTKEFISKEGVQNSNVKLVPRGTVLMSFKLTIGRTAIAGRDLYTNEAIAAFIPTGQLDNDFLFHWLPHLVGTVETDQAVKGATLNKQKLAAVSGPLPPLKEQRRIADVLGSADRAIAAAQATIRQADALWHGLTETLIWSLSLQKPNCVRPLGFALRGSDYGVNAPLTTEPKGQAVLRMGNIQDGYVDLSGLKWGQIPAKEAASLALVEGDILFNRTNSRDLVGKVALVREPTDCLYASYLVRLSVDRDVADPYYLFAAMHSARAQNAFKSIATPGVSQSNINPTNLKKQPVPLPDLPAQLEIADQLRSVEEARRRSLQELESISAIKRDLAVNLLSGRVRVPA